MLDLEPLSDRFAQIGGRGVGQPAVGGDQRQAPFGGDRGQAPVEIGVEKVAARVRRHGFIEELAIAFGETHPAPVGRIAQDDVPCALPGI